MNCICGIVDFEAHEIDFEDLRRMARALQLRGHKKPCAYIKKGVGLYFATSEENETKQPLSIIRGGRSYTLLADAPVVDSLVDPLQALLGDYLSKGIECFSELDPPFALALLDESRHKLFLARDSLGIRPLYYSLIGTRLIFASEIKGILAYMNGPVRVSIDAYRKLIVAPAGMLSGEDIYPDIHELPREKLLLFRDGHLKLYDKKSALPSLFSKKIYPTVSCEEYTPNDLKLALAEILYAFDYPRFDPYILGLAETLRSKCKEFNGFFCYEDALLSECEPYSFENADRLSSLFGVNALPIYKKNRLTMLQKRPKEIEKKLTELVEELSEITLTDGVIHRLAGDTVFRILKKERDATRRVSILAMLCQSVFWLEAYNLVFVD